MEDGFLLFNCEKKLFGYHLSVGLDTLTFCASRNEVYNEALKIIAEKISIFLKQLIKDNYSFIICKSTGNQNEVHGEYQYFKKDEEDNSKYPYLYYRYEILRSI